MAPREEKKKEVVERDYVHMLPFKKEYVI